MAISTSVFYYVFMNSVATLHSQVLPQIITPSLLAQLMVATHSIQKSTMEQLESTGGYEKLSLADADYITRFASRDYSPGELADELGISRQACSKVVRELESRGVIARRPNPEDSRSSVLSLTAAGTRLIHDGVRASNAVLGLLADTVGGERLQRLTLVLEKIVVGLQLAIPAMPSQMPQPTRLNLLLPILSEFFREQMASSLRKKGFDGLGTGNGQVLGLVAREELRIQDVASVLGVSKQAVAFEAAELDRLGYLTRLPDPHDGRQLLLCLAPKGKQLVAAGMASEQTLEDSIKAVLSAAEYRFLEESVAIWYSHVADQYDVARVLRGKIQQLSKQLLADLGMVGARALAQQLITLTREKS